MPGDAAPLVLVSNRGPVTYQEDGSVKRGTGGRVTALTGLASHREAGWIASGMRVRGIEVACASAWPTTAPDIEASRENDDHPFTVEAPHGGEFRVRFVASDANAYDGFY